MAIIDFKSWCIQKNLSENQIKVISSVRDSDPSRKVRSGSKNMAGFYSSRKMGVTIQFESHTVELPGIYEKEVDDNVLEYYDQPPPFNIEYKGNKKKLNHKYTPDFFVIKNNWVGWEEWKTEEALMELEQKNPERYYKDENSVWRCPPGEWYAKQYGLSFRVRSSAEINWNRLNNIQFLEDYLYDDKFKVPINAKEAILEEIKTSPGMALYDLLKMKSDLITADNIYYLMVSGEICVDLDNYVITDYKKFPLFADELTRKTYNNLKNIKAEEFIEIETLDLSIGSSIQWGNNIFEILNIDEQTIWLIGEGGTPTRLPVEGLYEFIEKGEIKGNNKRHITIEEQEIREIVNSLTPEEMQDTLRKVEIVERFIENPKYSEFGIPPRTIRLWKQKYIEGEKKYNSGFFGLISQIRKRGNRVPKLTDNQVEEMKKVFKEHYENKIQKNISSAYKIFKINCKRKGIPPVSYKTFRIYLYRIPLYERVLFREGKRAAYKLEEFYWELNMKKTPRHGVRPFEIVHIDHTELEIELVCSETGENLGRPWITFMVDAYTRRVLSYYLTYDSPSYRSNMMVIREFVKRHKRMPSTLVVDGGSDFKSVYFDVLLAINKVTKKLRPGAKPRFGAVIERLFGTLHTTFIHNLVGNTQSTKKNVRLVTPQVNPKRNAVWTLEMLNEAMHTFVYEIYDNTHHDTLNTTPRSIFIEGLKLTGYRKQTFITDFELFKMLTLPSTRSGMAKVQPGGYGIKINTIKYWDELFRDPKFTGKKVKVRYDPFDISVAYAYLDNQWVMLHSDYKHSLEGKTEKERKLASAELRRRNKLNGINKDITLEELIEFMESNEGKEATELQRKKDQSSKAVLQAIDGGKSVQQTPKRKDYNQDSVKQQIEKPSRFKDELLSDILSNKVGGFGRFNNG